MEVDGLGGTEVKTNRVTPKVEKCLHHILNYETTVRLSHGFNTKKKFGSKQEGVTCVVTFNFHEKLHTNPGHDPGVMGRRNSLRIQENNSKIGSITTAYISSHPIKSK